MNVISKHYCDPLAIIADVLAIYLFFFIITSHYPANLNGSVFICHALTIMEQGEVEQLSVIH